MVPFVSMTSDLFLFQFIEQILRSEILLTCTFSELLIEESHIRPYNFFEKPLSTEYSI